MRAARGLCAAVGAAAMLAAAAAETSPEFVRCMDDAIAAGALINVGRLQCVAKERRAHQLVLDQLYAARESGLAPAQRQRLRAARRRWDQFRQDWCALRAVAEPAPHPEVARGLCEIDLLDEQVKRMQSTPLR